jgi:hypothetical protein
MPRVSETYAGQYLNASELAPLGSRRMALIHHVTQELIGQARDAKLVLSLVSAAGKPWPKEVVLNKTNALHLQAAYGDDTDAWTGKQIDIWAENVQFQGRVVPGIRLVPSQAANGQGGALPAPARAAPQPQPQPQAAAPPQSDSIPGDIDDEIPF